MNRLTTHNRPTALRTMDRRTWQARLVEKTYDDFVNHVGGDPTPVQIALINRIAMVTLHVAEIDKRATNGEDMSEHEHRAYLDWNAALAELIAKLNVGSPVPV